MSTNAEAGPSTEIPLRIEPVHIYTSSSSTFERERTLSDVLADGTNVFAQRKPAAAQLSEDVRRLWSERGDFSRFRTEDLKRGREADAVADESDDEEVEGKSDPNEDEQGLLRKSNERVGGTIAEGDFVELRNRVLASLDVAHFNSIHAHQLLGMLLKQHRSASSTSGGAAARMGSPAPSVGGQSARSASTTAPTKAPLGIFAHLQAGSNREEEFVLDPLAISLSRTSLNASTAVRRDLSTDDADEEEDEYDVDPTSSEYALKQAKRELEAGPGWTENKLREFKIVLETKRQAIRNAAELLDDAAGELRRSQAGNRERWRSLIGLHGRGWGMTPGRPLLDVERFGVSTNDEEEANEASEISTEGEAKKRGKRKDETKKSAAGLQGFGTPIVSSDGKVKDEGARDAWIGFGLPEAPIELRRRSIAYWADLPSGSGGATAEEVKKKLVFPDRMHRRLRVRFVLWPAASSTSNSVGQQEETRMEWSSDASPGLAGNEKQGPVVAGQILDQELQQASREATDELVFGDVVAQARLLPPAFGVRLTSSSVRIVLTKRLDLVVELVPTTDSTAEGSASPEASEATTTYAPHAALLLAFLRLGPLRKYQAFVNATELGRRSDAAARAAGIKAGALAVPKKSGSAGTGKGDTKGVAAGGKSTSASLARLDTVGPVMVGLHYWSFVHRLGKTLQDVQARALDRGIEVKVQLVPVMGSGGSLTQLTRTLGGMVDATPSLPYPRESSAGQETAKLDALQGHAKVFVHARGSQRLVATLTFSQPSLLTVQFTAAPKSTGVRLTTKPLAVDLDTLQTLLGQQLAHYS